jgi:hypothetical protein
MTYDGNISFSALSPSKKTDETGKDFSFCIFAAVALFINGSLSSDMCSYEVYSSGMHG